MITGLGCDLFDPDKPDIIVIFTTPSAQMTYINMDSSIHPDQTSWGCLNLSEEIQSIAILEVKQNNRETDEFE